MDELQKTINNLEICRLCLNVTAAKVNIFTEDFAEMIEILTSLRVTQEDSLPKISCLKCVRDVKAAFLIRRRIIQSDRTFNTNLKISEDAQKPSLETNVNISESNKPIDILKAILNETSIQAPDSSDSGSREVIEDQLTIDEERNNMPKLKEINIIEKLDSILKPQDSVKFSDEQFRKIQSLRLKINSKYINNLKTLYAKRNKSIDMITEIKDDPVSEVSNNNSDNDTSKEIYPSIVPKCSASVQVQVKKKKEISKTYCKECEIKFNNMEAYKNHMKGHKSKMCPICNKMITVNYLKKHINLHDASPTICHKCGNSCKNSASLRMHLVYYHRGGIVCETCGKVFRSKTKLMFHRRKDHMKERNHKCEICGQTFFFKIYLERHVQTKHMKLRPHICEYCGKGYSSRHVLRTHLRQHTNEAPFPCNICNERFRQRISLRGHMKSRHGIKEQDNVFCDHCGKGFVSDAALDIHLRLHKQIKCKWCTDKFAEQAYLDQHILNQHSDRVGEQSGRSESEEDIW